MSTLSCPVPFSGGEQVLLAHGEGARLSRLLIREIFVEAFDNPYLRLLGDGAALPNCDGRIVMTTDSYVVSPLFFPGGDIGKLAVHGTINDLAVCGAEPLFLSAAFIIEEGLAIATLRRVVRSMSDAARACGIQIVTGDTKVVPHGSADGVFVNSTGIGRLRADIDVGPHRVQLGDRILVSGTIGDHGIAVLSAREKLGFETAIESDTASVAELVRLLVEAGVDIHFLRDPTRGGLSAVLHEVSEATGLSMLLDESALPVSPSVRGACELLGLDPLHVANEGKLVAIVGEADVEGCLAAWRRSSDGRQATVVGEVKRLATPHVLVRNALGVTRVVDEPTGAPLPRIC